MADRNIAREVLWPTNSKILIRVAFLHVGQGQSSIVIIRNGQGYKVHVVDINFDRKVAGIDVPKLVKDLLKGQSLDAFVNTHPHDDHLCGTQELSDAVDIKGVWHSNHKPSKKYGSKHSELTALITKVKKKYGDRAEIIIEGSRSAVIYGDAAYHFLAPAEHVTDDVNEEDADERRARIHEQCGVIKYGKGKLWVAIVGDADRWAFEKHITEYHRDRLPSVVLAASHHGSRSFFMENEGDDPYKDGLAAIDPDYVVVSSPKQKESKHEHPHDDAMKLYKEHVGDDNVLHTGEQRYCFITDVFDDGTYSGIQDDKGELAESYGLEDEDDDGDDKKKESSKSSITILPAPYSRTRVDDRPMGAN